MQLYRIRNINQLLRKYSELEEQQIYFATLDELNDPMEGFRDIVWKGDRIVWENLFRNYISCLNLTISFAIVDGNRSRIHPENIPIEGLQGDFEAPIETTILDELCNAIFDRCKLQQLICRLSGTEHTVRRGELLMYLKCIHFFAIDEIRNYDIRHGLSTQTPKSHSPLSYPKYLRKFPELIEKIHNEQPNISEEAVADLFSVYNLIYENLSLMKKYDQYNAQNNSPGLAQLNWDFICLDFPKFYLDQLRRILFPDWYVACFLEECSNSSVWGHYGDNHRGAALIFNVGNKSEDLSIELKRVARLPREERNSECGSSDANNIGPDFSQMLFHKISYKGEIDQIDFFRSIGMLPTGRLIKQWYTDHSGNMSKCAAHIDSSNEGYWRENYWRNFFRDISIKTDDWAYEKE